MTPSSPEPDCDIKGQFELMLAGHKPAVFIAARHEGTLFTTSQEAHTKFRDADPLTDSLMAELLEYPKDKMAVIPLGDAFNAQVLDKQGRVVKEAVVSPSDGSLVEFVRTAKVPLGGIVILVSGIDAQMRRAKLRAA